MACLAGLSVMNADQHELLGKEAPALPAVIRSLAQAVRDLREERVAPIRRSEVQDESLVSHGNEVAHILWRSLTEIVEVSRHMNAANK